MSKEKVTAWYPESAKPVRKGVYATEFTYGYGYSLWNGEFWGNQMDTIKECVGLPKHNHGIQEKRWRGLTTNPKKAK